MALTAGDVCLIKIDESQLAKGRKLLGQNVFQVVVGEYDCLEFRKQAQVGYSIHFCARNVEIDEWRCHRFLYLNKASNLKFLKTRKVEDLRWHDTNSVGPQVQCLERGERRKGSSLNLRDHVVVEIQKSQFLVIRERVSRQLSESIFRRVQNLKS
jgi:hypothetical protein